MKKILLFPLSLLLLFICLSCTRDVILKLDPAPPVLVLNASVTPEREVAAFLSKSWFLLDSVPEYDLPDEGVKVDVYVNDAFRGTMQRSDDPADNMAYKGQFRLPGYHVQAGDKVRLEAQAPGFDPVKGETIIPSKTDILSLDTASVITSDYSSARTRIYLTLKDDPSVRNYYRLVVERLIEYRKGDKVLWVSSFNDNGWESPVISGDSVVVAIESSNFRLFYDDPAFQQGIPSPALEEYDGTYCRGVLSDEMFEGKEYTLTSSFFTESSFKNDSIEAIVHYDIHLMSISEAYYNYLKKIRGFSISLGDAFLDGLLEPTAIYSNVTDGFGVVTGYQISTRRLTMPFGDRTHVWY